MAGAKAALGILFSVALAAMAFPMGACWEIAQPSPENNTLYFHYQPENKTGWMNTILNGSTSASYKWDARGFGKIQTFTFPLNPGLDANHNLVMDLEECWTIRVHINNTLLYGGPLPFIINGTLTLGNYSVSSEMDQREDKICIFEFRSDCDVILNKWNITFTVTISTHSEGGFYPEDLELITDGSSNLTMPILAMDADTDDDGIINSRDPDDDNDGHNDTKDAYPTDPKRWQPTPARGLLHWYDALAMVIMIGLLVASFDRHERLSGPLS